MTVNTIWPGLFESQDQLGGGGVPVAHKSKTINDNEMKFGGVSRES